MTDKLTTQVKGKLHTGETIEIDGVSADAHNFDNVETTLYVGEGQMINDGVTDERTCHLWIPKRNYSLPDIKLGDRVMVYMDNISKSPDMFGNRTYIKWLTVGQLIGTSEAFSLYKDDGTPVGIPFFASDIACVSEGNTGINLIKGILAKNAINLGGIHMEVFAKQFNELPLSKGDYISAGHDYAAENNKLNIRNNHKVLNSPDLTFESWTIGKPYVVVKAITSKKITFLALNSLHKR